MSYAFSPSRPRGGVALIIALIILAGLLLLGLPFLFTQSEALSGSRSYAYHQATAVGLTNGEQTAAAAVATGLEHHLVAGQTDSWTREDDDLASVGMLGDVLTPNLFALNTSSTGLTAQRESTAGAWIEDEHGKLNPNDLSPAAWTRLLATAGIIDWDDNEALDSQDFHVDPVGDQYGDGNFDDDGKPGLDGDALKNGDNDDGDNFGELAEALANVRFTLPGRRVTSIDQLLLADPGHNTDAAPGGSDYLNNATPTGRFGFRRPLTRAELDRVRPFLTLYTPAPGREGLLDLGSMLAVNSDNYMILDDDPWPMARSGSAAVWPEVLNGEDYQYARVNSVAVNPGGQNVTTAITLDVQNFVAGRALGITAPAPVNLHHALPAVADALQAPMLASTVQSLAGLPTADFRRVDPLSTGVELPPVGIASKGIIAIVAGSTAADQLGRVAAERHRRSIVQAVPTQQDLEERWLTQDTFYGLVAMRYASRMTSWPKPVGRITDQLPDDVLGPSADTSAPIGVTAAVEPSTATGWINRRQNNEANRKASHLDIDFRVPFGTDKAAADPVVMQDRVEPTVGGGTAGIDQLRPDGLRINGDFTWTSAPAGGGSNAGGPLRMVNVGTGPADADRSLTGRHFGMWFKPHTDWSTSEKIYPVLECRSPAINLGPQINGTAGSNELQNYIAVLYDRERQLLVTVIAPPIIEHTTDWGPLTLFDNFDPVTSSLIDERCLGDASQEVSPYASAPSVLLPLAPKQPYPGGLDEWDEASAKYTTQVSKLYKPNRVVHCYKVADPDDPLGGGPVPFFRKDRWYRLDLVIAGDRPGDVLTIIDGIVGQDVSRTPPASADDMVTGDRLTLPAMPLVTALPLVAQPPAAGGADYLQPTIEVLPVLGLNAEDLYPARGVIRIDDEYIAYESVTLNTFSNCQRAQRQNTRTDDPSDSANWWPLTQEHLPGTMVVPGGYRLHLTQGTIYAGGCTLDANLGNGDAVAGPQQWLIWSRLDHTQAPVIAHPTITTLMQYPLTATSLFLSTEGVPAQFPPRGIIEMSGQFFAYNGISGNELQNIVDLSAFAFAPAPAPALLPRTDVDFPIPGGGIEAPMVTLVGFPLTGNPLTAGAYDVNNGPMDDAFLLQIAHPLSGRIEWVSYTNLAHEGAQGGFAIHRSGWGVGTRGKQRTDFTGNVGTHLNPLHFFPAGSDVIPVQTELGGVAHWVMTGDVVSLVPRQPEVSGPSIQAVVRYATVDGYDATGGNAAPDTKNEYFAFGHSFPNAINAADYDLVVWPGWSATDLTPMNPVTAPRGTPFRLDIAAPGNDPTAGVDLAIIGRDPEGIAPATAATLASARDASVGGATVDALVAGNLDLPDNNTSRTSGMGIVRAIDGTGEVIADVAQIGAIVQFNLPGVFTRPYGLVNIAGETFAYRQLLTAEATVTRAALGGIPGAPSFANPKALQDSHQFAILIARGLLDLTDPASVVVNLPAGPVRVGSPEQIRPLIPAIPLPLGPVAQLNADLTDFTLGTLDTGILAAGGSNPESIAHGGFDAPYALVCTPTGEANAATMVAFAGGVARRRVGANPPIWDTEYTTAPWLRGLYNTDPAGAGVAGDIVIGWWPRLPPAMPGATHPETNNQAIYRCRRFAWIGFPMAMHGARFDLSANPATVTIDNSLVRTDNLFQIEARAASVADPDWTRAAINIVPGFGSLSGLDALFSGSPDFIGADVSGAELRVCWRYAVAQTSLLDGIAEAGSRAPFITAASLRWRAPLAVLAVEEAR